ncbi:MAG: metal-dependent transcriptional regulator [Phycisphaerae bacterium]|nr:metal-dependent transcriptional regulator [Phycisphaerae bacterium]
MKTPQQLSASLEDYLEAIYLLSRTGKAARSKNIAEHLQVARPSVTAALRTLAEKELIFYKPYGYITLTEKGAWMAGRIVRRHAALEEFFRDVLGVDADAAERAACLAEHAIGPEITLRLTGYLAFVEAEKKSGHNISDSFEAFFKKHQQDIKASCRRRVEKMHSHLADNY